MTRTFRRVLSVALLGFAGLISPLQADSFNITGTVASVGGNLGTDIVGGSSTFAIRLTYNPVQTPHLIAAGTGQTASYRLLETAITIYGVSNTYTWSLSTPLADNSSHNFGITNDNSVSYSPAADVFSSGLSGATFSGPALNGKNFSHWSLNWVDNHPNTAFSNTSIPSSIDVSAFNYRPTSLIFTGFTNADSITLNTLAISVIPEPAGMGVMAGLAGLVAVLSRRRRI